MSARMNRILNKPNQDAKAVLVSLKNMLRLLILKKYLQNVFQQLLDDTI